MNAAAVIRELPTDVEQPPKRGLAHSPGLLLPALRKIARLCSEVMTQDTRQLFRLALNPISGAGSNHEAWTLDDDPDFVESALIEVVR